MFYAFVFSISVFLLGGIIFLIGRHSLEEQLRARIEAEASQLLAGYRNDGLEELRHDVKDRIEASPAHRLQYSLQDRSGRVVFDGIIFPPSPGWHRLTTREGQDLLLLTLALDEDYLMAVAADMDGVTAIERTVRNTFLLAFVFTLFIGVTGGVVVSRRFLTRVDRLTRTAESIGRGNLSERVPVSGAGDDFDQLATTINRMLGQIEQLMEGARQVSTSIAHELRTPLGRLRQKLEALQAMQASSTSRTLCEDSLSTLDETLGTFSALLRIAEMESGSFSAAFTPVDLSALLPDLVESYRPVAEERSQELTAEVAPCLRVNGDKSLLTQLFANLIENALRHTGAGTHIRVGARQEGDIVVAQVCDDGPGIPASERELITKPFYRLDRSRHTRGSGLGLSLAAAIAALHGASLRLEDNAPGLSISVSGAAWGSPRLARRRRDDEAGPADAAQPSRREEIVTLSACRRTTAGLAVAVGALLGAVAPAPARADTVLLAAGDIGKCTDVGERGPYLTADLLAMRTEAVILALGDLAYSHGTAAEFANCYGPTWGRFKDRTRPVPGNHEYRTADASGYFGYWGPQARPDGHSYYSFDLSDWHLVALDTNLDVSADSAQARWLRSDLAGSAARCKLAFFHHPRFSSGMHGDSPEMGAIFRILYDARVSVALAGHDHHYERFAPLDPSGEVEPTRGVRSFVVGTGGGRLRALEGIPRPGSEAWDVGAKGVLQLVLRADGYDWAFLPVDGASYSDSGSGTCVPAGEGANEGPNG